MAETEAVLDPATTDERTLRELYLKPFEIAVKDGGSNAIMSAFNRIGSVEFYCFDTAAGSEYIAYTSPLDFNWEKYNPKYRL